MDSFEHKHAIIIIRNSKNEYLNCYDERWEGYLFLNCKINNEFQVDVIKDEVSKKLRLLEQQIKVSFVWDKVHSKFSESAKIEKTYHHYFFDVEISNLPDYMLYKEFVIDDKKYKWYSMNELELDERIQKINSDIVRYVKDIFKN